MSRDVDVSLLDGDKDEALLINGAVGESTSFDVTHGHLPLRHGDQGVGVLKGTSPLAGAFDHRDGATLTGLAELVTAAIAAGSELSRAPDVALPTAKAGPDVDHDSAPARISAFDPPRWAGP